MAWRERFAAGLFALWRKHGLADSLPDEDYDRLIGSLAVPRSVEALALLGCRPLEARTLASVYRFGAFAGVQLGRLLGLDDGAVAQRSGMCGRFNLGISLFDYICDEEGRLESLLGREPFLRLAAAAGLSPSAPASEPGPAERALVSLATGILQDVADLAGPPDPSSPLWHLLLEMIAAEARVARAGLGPGIDAEAMTRMGRAKSAGPFAWMAEWMAAAGSGASNAEQAGWALGSLYWIADDARDLWEDLDRRRPNLFLFAAARREPALLEGLGTASFELELSRVLVLPDFIDALVEPEVEAFAAELSRGCDPGTARSIAGLVARSVARWLA